MKNITQLTKLLQAQKRLFMILLAALSQPAFAQDVGYWDDRFSAIPFKWNSENIYWIDAIAVTDGGDIYASGLSLVGGIIKWNGNGWSPFAGGNGSIYAFATVGNDIYVGGDFTKLDSIQANRIARYNRITQSWLAMATDGFNGINHQEQPSDGYYYRVYALDVYENNLYVGGSFTKAGAVNAKNIAQWDIATNTWTALGDGVNGTVRAIVVKNGEVYVGGGFNSAGGVPVNNIAKWNGHEWSALGDGVNGAVRALTICGDDLYVGGGFSKAGGNNARNIAKWNTADKVWSPLGAGVSGGVLALASDGRVVYAGGGFIYADEMQAGSIVKWNPAKSCWSRVGGNWRGDGGSVDGQVNTILIRGNDIYLGGKFQSAGGKPSHLFAIWHEPASPNPHAPAWSSVPDVTFQEDDSTQLELYQYVTDTEHDLRGGLNFSATVISPPAAANSNDLQIRLQKVIMGPSGRYQYATFASAKDASGIYTVVFTVMDACGASAYDTIQVTVTPMNNPPVLAALAELRFDEDKVLLYPIHNWYSFVADKDNVDSTLTFVIQSGKNVKAARQTGNFRFSAPANWFGKDTLQLIVTDPSQLADTTSLMVTVNPVNDAPKISGLPDSLIFKKGGSVQLKLWDYVEDVETPDRQLTYTFSTSNSSLLRKFDYTTGALILTAPQFHGRAQLFINVSDSKAGAQDTVAVRVELPTGVASHELALPTAFQLWPNSPNPFNPGTMIRFDTPSAGRVKLAVYTLRGELVQILVNGEMAAGAHQVHFDSHNLASGIFFYRMETDSYVMTRKMLLQK